MRDDICSRFSSLVDTSQMIVSEDLFLDAFHMSEDSRRLIQKVILEQGQSYPEFGEKLPKNWYQLQGKIEKMRKKGLRIIEYSKLEDANQTLEEPLSQEQLELFLSFQHNSGFLLHFNEPHLKHIVVLDPKLIIDATKSIITCPAFALDIWGKAEWEQMVETGKIEEGYIKEVWKKRDKNVLYTHWQYLLLVLRKLDIVTKPKVYLKGFDVSVSFYYIPCMLQTRLDGRETESSERYISMVFRFRDTDILPPAIYNRFVASCLALWEVENGRLYDGMVALRSGPFHILVIKRESGSINVSIKHKSDATKIDNNLVRSFEHFTGQTLQRIISLYNTTSQQETERFYTIEYNDFAISKGIGQDEGQVFQIYFTLD